VDILTNDVSDNGIICSQGALCARKSLGNLGDAADKVVAFVTFGDPKRVWEADIDFPELPASATEISFCNSAPTDPLCGDLLEDFPSTPTAVIDHLKDIWEAVDDADMNDAQKGALVDLVVQLPQQALGQLGRLGKDIINGNLGRWMLTPEHFWYGMDDSVSKAADEIVAVL
jgi:cutinase